MQSNPIKQNAHAQGPKILIFGVGAVGTCYLHMLMQAGCEVTGVCRSNYSAAKQNGFTLHSALFGNHIRLHPRVVRRVKEVEGMSFDYVLVTAKAFPGTSPSTAALLRPAIKLGHTSIVILQNGIGIEDEYEMMYPSNLIISCVVNLHATQHSSAIVTMGLSQLLELGIFRSHDPHNTKQQPPVAVTDFRNLISKGGGKATLFQDIQPRRWTKLLVNASWNPVCALTRLDDASVLQSCPEAMEYIRRLMSEVINVAHGLGYFSVTQAAAEERLDAIAKQSSKFGHEPSMSADVRRKRPLEIEAILGNTIRIAKTKNVEVTNLEGLYVLLCGLNIALEQ
ncbi:2-dehydropantoate 2-reductase [Aureobasidium melanogenum CBS 110374]|uniref:2-dehydropantoate 2-reductase n=1 Tax=Aureobasidium melanogenum (strain CBS 110374) TaxID=1043003 RepID=A0A074VAE0_AURM1|nr:2-dehydropantoate 2-reductase [Aureobasidium melanogenum CBS 110374]KEQ57590.1 2-dehydropantoate 2-reductase [Aureobasidium melanogenum CBS 110374]